MLTSSHAKFVTNLVNLAPQRYKKKVKGKNVDLYSAYRVLHTCTALSSLN